MIKNNFEIDMDFKCLRDKNDAQKQGRGGSNKINYEITPDCLKGLL